MHRSRRGRCAPAARWVCWCRAPHTLITMWQSQILYSGEQGSATPGGRSMAAHKVRHGGGAAGAAAFPCVTGLCTSFVQRPVMAFCTLGTAAGGARLWPLPRRHTAATRARLQGAASPPAGVVPGSPSTQRLGQRACRGPPAPPPCPRPAAAERRARLCRAPHNPEHGCAQEGGHTLQVVFAGAGHRTPRRRSQWGGGRRRAPRRGPRRVPAPPPPTAPCRAPSAGSCVVADRGSTESLSPA